MCCSGMWSRYTCGSDPRIQRAMVGTRTNGPEQLALQPARQRHRGEHRRLGIRGVDLVALVDVIVAAHHVRHRPAERCAQRAERREVLVPELAAARRSVRKLLPRARMGARPDEIGQALRIVPVAAFRRDARADPSAESRHEPRAARRERTARAVRRATILTASFPARPIHSCARFSFRNSEKSDGDTVAVKRAPL